MPSTREILKQTGLTDQQIDALDANVLKGFDTVLTTSEQQALEAQKARDAAELAHRAQKELYETQIAPALDGWGSEKATLEATVEFYRKQNEGARAAGFLPKDAPGYQPTGADEKRDQNGRFVPGPTGSPQFLTADEGIKAVSNVTWVMSEYQRLHNAPLPDDFETLMRESIQNKLPFRDHVSRKYNFDGKRQEIAAARQKEHDDKIAKETEERINKQWAEKLSNNPNTNVGVPSQFDTIRRGIDAKTVADPLTMTKDQRHAATRSMIHKDLAETMAGTVH